MMVNRASKYIPGCLLSTEKGSVEDYLGALGPNTDFWVTALDLKRCERKIDGTGVATFL